MDSTAKAYRDAGERWWQDWRWLAAVGVILMSIAFSAFVAVSLATHQEVVDQTPIIQRLDNIAGANQDAIAEIQSNQDGIDTIVAFVEEIRAEEAEGGGQDVVVTVLHILCSSSDPVRIEACERLRGGEGEG